MINIFVNVSGHSVQNYMTGLEAHRLLLFYLMLCTRYNIRYVFVNKKLVFISFHISLHFHTYTDIYIHSPIALCQTQQKSEILCI